MRYSTGSAAATRLAPFGATFLRVERSARDGVEPVSNLDRASAFSDIVWLAIPWTSEKRRLFDAKRLAKMKPGALPSSPSKAPNVLITARVAGVSARFTHRALKPICEQVERLVRDEPQNIDCRAHNLFETI
jgi:phosphoglycerate dehydrogenase-like enzyme